jgi:hypothetical protein
MKKNIFMLAIVAASVFLMAGIANAQGGVKQGPEVERDPEMEKDSLHNLEAARMCAAKKYWQAIPHSRE